jgi:hypothetical protein
MSERLDGGRFEAPRDYTGAVRGVRLRRRRSRVPWIYLVYHVQSTTTGGRRRAVEKLAAELDAATCVQPDTWKDEQILLFLGFALAP